MTGLSSAEPVRAITLHLPWTSLIALGIKSVETGSWPAPERLVGQFAVHSGRRLVRRPGDAIERELRARLGENWRVIVPTGAVVATAVLAGMAQAEHINPLEGRAVHDPGTEVGCAAGRGRTSVDPWRDFSSGRWPWFLDDVEALPEMPSPRGSCAESSLNSPTGSIGNSTACTSPASIPSAIWPSSSPSQDQPSIARSTGAFPFSVRSC